MAERSQVLPWLLGPSKEKAGGMQEWPQLPMPALWDPSCPAKPQALPGPPTPGLPLVMLHPTALGLKAIPPRRKHKE